MSEKPTYEELEQRVNELKKELAGRQNDGIDGRQSLSIFSSLIEASADAIIMSDDKQNIIVWNPGAEKLFGYKKEEVMHCDYTKLIVPEEIIPTRDKAFKEVIRTKQLYKQGQIIETEGKRKDGLIFPMEHTVSLWVDGETIYIIAILRDITLRKKAEVELLQREQFYKKQDKIIVQLAKSPDLALGRLESFLNNVNEIVCETLNVERSSAWFCNEDQTEIVCADLYEIGSQRHTKGLVLKREDYPVYFEAACHVRQILVDNAHEDPRTREFLETYLSPLGITSMLDTAFYSKGKPQGILCLEHVGTARKWKKEEAAFAGALSDLISIAIENSERIKIENEKNLVAYELAELIETANAPIFGTDKEGRINGWNQTITNITGYNKEEVMGKDIVQSYISEDYKATVKKVLDIVLRGEETSNFELQFNTKEGKRITALLNFTARRDVEGSIVGMVGMGQDITELNRYRENLENIVKERTEELNISLTDTETARDRIDGILKSIADGLIVTDTHNRVILMNRAAEDILNVRFSEVIDRPIDYAIKDETLRDRMKSTLNKEQTGYEFDFELPGSVPKQTLIMRARTSVIVDKDRKTQGIVTIITDVTHEREIDRMKTEFLSTAAHELRTPLTSIQGFSEIILTRDNISPEERKKFLTYINQQAIGLNKIVSDLLDISRIESGKGFTLNKQPCEVGWAIKGVGSFFQDKHPDRQFEITLPEKPVEVHADKDKMAQVLKNLVSNAIKYSPEGGKIHLTGKVLDGWFQVSVEDHGMGMTPEQIDKVFDKFYRADASNTAIEGTGLGMSIVKYIVEAHGGKVWVESEYGKGTTVTFRIPL
ncbi:MAG: PAS domain S-box protein [Candidatus Anammoxibacter sp.]